MILDIFYIVLWFIGLIYGAKYLVKGAASLSLALWIPQIVVWLTVVAFGTSTPELLVNTFSAYEGVTDLAIGNVVWSNIWNILFILWTALLFSSIPVKKNTTWKEIPFAILASLVLFIMTSDIAFDGATQAFLTRTESMILLWFFAIFMYYIFAISKDAASTENQEKIDTYPLKQSAIFCIIGLLGLFIGGKVLVEWAVNIARGAWISEMFIGLTILAIGTSLPEFVTSIEAARKKQTDMIIGNIIGSNIFNIFWILWVTGLFGNIRISQSANSDIQFLLVCSILVFVFLFLSKEVYQSKNWFKAEEYILKKWHWIVLILSYIMYISYLVWRG